LTERHHGERIEKKSVQTSKHEHAPHFASFSDPLRRKPMKKEENEVTKVTSSKVMKKIES